MHFLKIIRNPYFILLSVVVFHLVNNIIVIRLDNTPLISDASLHYILAKNYFYTAKLDNFYPPFLSFLSFSFFKIFGVSQKVAALGIGGFSLFLVVITTYLLAKDLYSEKIGLLSVFILSCSPLIFGNSRTFMPDLLCAGWVTFFILLLAQPQGLISLESAVFLGGVMALGMLTRVIYPFYIISPLIYFVKKKKAENKKIYSNLFIMIFVCLFICSFWYFPNIYPILQRYAKVGQFDIDFSANEGFQRKRVRFIF